jgi:hypothetical protein
MLPRQEQCLACHQMQERMRSFRPESDPHNGQCGLCHNPHTQTTVVGAYQTCATSNCHARSDTLTAMHRGFTGRHKLETCGACHVAHTWKAGQTTCTDCHSGISDPAVRVRRPPDGDAPSATPPHVGPLREPPLLIPASFDGRHQAAPVLARHAAGRSHWRRAFHTASIGPVVPVVRQARVIRIAPQARDTARFEHARHRSVTCTTCHTSNVAHGGLKVSVARRCTACHHGETALGRSCDRCHQPGELAGPHAVTVSVSMTVWPAPRPRTLSFEHGRHARIACADCHDDSLARTVEKTCASCHVDHHAASRTCTGCHQSALTGHTRAVHLTGCAGSGCHAAERTAATNPVRSVCVACHVSQADHKPGRDCASCHLSRWPLAATTGGS